jgi:hypothetical protein
LGNTPQRPVHHFIAQSAHTLTPFLSSCHL